MKNNFVSEVFKWLYLGLFVTFGLGYLFTLNYDLAYMLLSNFQVIAIAELIVGLVFILLFNRLSETTAKVLYLVYAALTGVTFTAIFIAFQVESILWIFLAAAVIFGVFGFIGKNIKMDLTGFGSFLLMSLLGMLALMLVNVFLGNNTLDLTICFVTLVIFIGYVVFDVNRIMKLGKLNPDEKLAVFWAFQLYLDIINIILKLIRLFGKRKN